jgi:hypothetical protein
MSVLAFYRLSVSNVNAAGKSTVILQTQGRSSLRESIVDVFGPKLVSYFCSKI